MSLYGTHNSACMHKYGRRNDEKWKRNNNTKECDNSTGFNMMYQKLQ